MSLTATTEVIAKVAEGGLEHLCTALRHGNRLTGRERCQSTKRSQNHNDRVSNCYARRHINPTLSSRSQQFVDDHAQRRLAATIEVDGWIVGDDVANSNQPMRYVSLA